jgi:hypothetical protein
MADETTPNAPAETSPAATKPAAAAKAKKEKPPALEDKPFTEFMEQHYLPALKTGLIQQGLADMDIDLRFEQRKVNITGFSQMPECWQVIGRWNSGYKQAREFTLYFFDESIGGQKGFSYSDTGGKSSTLESFRIDERKVDLSLLVFWTLQRLNAQKWLVRN